MHARQRAPMTDRAFNHVFHESITSACRMGRRRRALKFDYGRLAQRTPGHSRIKDEPIRPARRRKSFVRAPHTKQNRLGVTGHRLWLGFSLRSLSWFVRARSHKRVRVCSFFQRSRVWVFRSSPLLGSRFRLSMDLALPSATNGQVVRLGCY